MFVGMVASAASFCVACVTAPPPDLQQAPQHPPFIVVGSALPSADQIVFTWPSEFSVQVEVDEPSLGFAWVALLDSVTVITAADVTNSGITVVTFDTQTPPDPTSCHTVQLLVAHSFLQAQGPPFTPDSVGGDQLTWFYMPGGVPNGCPSFDGGLDSGVGPEADASPEGGDP